jgi:hypothetical protein
MVTPDVVDHIDTVSRRHASCGSVTGASIPDLYICYHQPVDDAEKARRILGFEAATALEEMPDEAVPGVERAVRKGSS